MVPPDKQFAMNPADLEMAVADAVADRPGSFIQNVQRICYAYDPVSHRFVLRIDRILLAVTLAVAGLLIVYLVRQGRLRKRLIAQTEDANPQ
jgi:hypothetical protein